jgi:hypothetical protein
MDYARFNYVAQPGDGISGADLYPRINYYDKWAIEWGYRLYPDLKTADQEKAKLNSITIEKLKDKKFWFGTESDPNDPRCQNEDLGDNAMKASMYGIKNLQRIMPNLATWTKTPNEGYENLKELYKELVGQYTRYMGHVAKNIGGIMTTPKTVEQEGNVIEFVSKATQKEAVAFLNEQLFTTPKWLLNQDIFYKISEDGASIIAERQDAILDRVMSNFTISKLVAAEAALGANAYKPAELFADLKKSIFSELATHQPVDIYKRNLQRSYVDKLNKLLAPAAAQPNAPAPRLSDATALARTSLTNLRTELRAASATGDATTRGHYQDLVAAISKTLDNK